MSAVSTTDSRDAVPSGVVRFTPRGEAALDRLATVLTAHCSGTPEGLANVMDQVMHADMTDLAEALTAIAEAYEERAHPRLDKPPAETMDAAAQRRLGSRDIARPGGADPGRGVAR